MKYKINQELRSQAFYLIKKYTSYRILDIVYQLNKDFVDAVERQLRHPSAVLLATINEYEQNQHEREFIGFLNEIACEEKGLKQLLISPYKNEAYNRLLS